MGKAETWEDTDWAKEERLQVLAQPMGRFQKQYRLGYTITKWIPNYRRLRRLKKRIQGLLQKSCIRRRYDCMGSLIYPSNIKRHLIERYLNSFSEIKKIYDTDGECTVDKVLYKYYVDMDMWKVLQTIKEVRTTKKRHTEEFIKHIYPEEEYDRKYQKVDTIY